MSRGDKQLSWTTTRCKRLLRPIASRLVMIRKSASKKTTKPDTCSVPKPVLKNSDDLMLIKSKPTAAETTPGHQRDPDWIADQSRKRRTKRFKRKQASSTQPNNQASNESSRSRQPRELPGEVCLPTPYLERTWNNNAFADGSPLSSTSATNGNDLSDGKHYFHAELQKEERKLQQKSKKSRFRSVADDEKIFQGLLEGFEHLLEATSKAEECRSCVRRTLFSTCLRQVPAYIEFEEQCLKEEDSGDDGIERISNDIYEDLESLGVQDQGWSPLREVVRGHGIRLIEEAVAEDLINNTHFAELIRVCRKLKAEDEAQRLWGALMENLHRKYATASSHILTSDVEVSSMICWAASSGRYSFMFRQLAWLVEYGVLPFAFLSSKFMAPVWTRLVGSLSLFSSLRIYYADAVRLLVATVRAVAAEESKPPATFDLASRNPELDMDTARFAEKEAHRQLVDTVRYSASSMTCLITAMGLSGVLSKGSDDAQNDGALLTSSPAYWALRMLTVHIFNDLEERNKMHCSTKPSEQVYLPSDGLMSHALTGMLILQVCSSRSWADLSKMSCDKTAHYLDILTRHLQSRGRKSVQSQWSVPNFICRVARCVGRAAQEDGSSALYLIVTAIAESTNRISFEKGTLRMLTVDSAEHFGIGKVLTQDVKTQTLLKELRDLEPGNDGTRNHLGSTRSDTYQEYRWDDVIDEWIAVTPAHGLKNARSGTHIPARVNHDNKEIVDGTAIGSPTRGPVKRPVSDLFLHEQTLINMPSRKRPHITSDNSSERHSIDSSEEEGEPVRSSRNSLTVSFDRSSRSCRDTLRKRRSQMRLASDALLGSKAIVAPETHELRDNDEGPISRSLGLKSSSVRIKPLSGRDASAGEATYDSPPGSMASDASKDSSISISIATLGCNSSDEDELSFQHIRTTSDAMEPLAARASANAAARKRTGLLISGRSSGHGRLRPSWDSSVRSGFEYDTDDVDF